jgi:hypothetical protein
VHRRGRNWSGCSSLTACYTPVAGAGSNPKASLVALHVFSIYLLLLARLEGKKKKNV